MWLKLKIEYNEESWRLLPSISFNRGLYINASFFQKLLLHAGTIAIISQPC